MYHLHQVFGFLFLIACIGMLVTSVIAVIKGRFRIFLVPTVCAIVSFLLWFVTLEALLRTGKYPGATGMEGLGIVVLGLGFLGTVLISIVLAAITLFLRRKS